MNFLKKLAIYLIILLGNLAFPSGYKYKYPIIEQCQKNYELALTRRDVDVNANAFTRRFLPDQKFAKFKAQLKPMKASLNLSPASWSDLLPISGNYNPNYKEKAPLSFRLLFAFDNTRGEASLKLVVESSWPSFIRIDDPDDVQSWARSIWMGCRLILVLVPRWTHILNSDVVRIRARVFYVNGEPFLEIWQMPVTNAVARRFRLKLAAKALGTEVEKGLIFEAIVSTTLYITYKSRRMAYRRWLGDSRGQIFLVVKRLTRMSSRISR